MSIAGAVVGVVCCCILRFMYLHCDAMADGNIDRTEKENL